MKNLLRQLPQRIVEARPDELRAVWLAFAYFFLLLTSYSILRPIRDGSPFVSQKFIFYIAQLNKPDLEFLRGLMESGKVTPVIDREYRFTEAPEALRYLEQGRARGKVIVRVDSAP